MATKVGGLFVPMSASSARIAKDFQAARQAAKKSTNGMRNDFKKTKSSAGGLSSKLGGLKGSIIAVAGPAALGLLIKKSLDAADRIAKIADTAGLSTDALQELSFAADLAGISTGDFETAMQAFNKRLGEARNGTGTLITILNKMNPALLENIRNVGNTEDAFDLIIDAASKTATGMDQAALLAAAFGRTVGVKMSRLVNDGTENLAKMRAEARRLGIVIEEDLLRGAESAKDSLATMGRVISSQVTSAVIALSPEIENIATSITNSLPKLVSWVNKFLELAGIKEENPLPEFKAALDETNAALKVNQAELDKIAWTAGTAFGDEHILKYQKEIERLTINQYIYQAAIKNIEDAEKAKAEIQRKAAVDEKAAADRRRVNAERAQSDQRKAIELSKEKVRLEKAEQAAAEAKFQAIAEFSKAWHDIQTDEFQLQREELARNVMDWEAAGVMKTEIERREAAARKQIAVDEFGFKLGKVNELMNAAGALADGITALESAHIDKRLAKDEEAANEKFKRNVEEIEKRYSVDGELTEAGLAKMADLQSVHDGRMNRLRDKADNDKKKAAKKMKPIKIAQAISNTAVAVTEAYPNIPLAILVGLLGAAQVATIAAQPFAKGGVVNGATLFNNGGGLGVMGEAGAEAIMPLARGANGELGVNASGAGSQEYTLIQNNYFEGITPEKFVKDTVAPQLEDGARRGMNQLVTNSKLLKVANAII